MDQSILNSTKKILGLDPDYTAFDQDVITHINSAFATLTQLGIGPVDGFMIEDATPSWSDILGNDLGLNMVKTYVYLKVRMVFDPQSTRYTIAAMTTQISELEWRMNIHREDIAWVSPFPPDDDDDVNPEDRDPWAYDSPFNPERQDEP
jgi:hypothetical protein